LATNTKTNTFIFLQGLLSQLIINNVKVQIHLFNSEFDQSETVWELLTENLRLNLDETANNEPMGKLNRVNFNVDNIKPSISLPKTQLLKLDFPLSVSYNYSQSALKLPFDPNQALEVNIPKLLVEMEVKVAGVFAKILQKDKEFINKNESSYSSKAKLIYSNILGNY
jgi:hypothetical protein